MQRNLSTGGTRDCATSSMQKANGNVDQPVTAEWMILSQPAKKLFKRLAILLMSDLLAPYIPGKGVI